MDNNKSKVIPVMEAVFDRNERMAGELNKKLSAKNVFCVNVIGAPGAGKTLSIQNIIAGLGEEACVIEGDIESDIDTKKLNALGIKTVQINTGGACHLDVPLVAKAEKTLQFSNGFLFIENIGNLVCPAEFMIGEHIKLLISTITEGSDKPYKYPLAYEKADIVLLNKSDLAAHIEDFDYNFFMGGIRKLNPSVPVFKVSGKTGEGFKEVIIWLKDKAKSILTKL